MPEFREPVLRSGNLSRTGDQDGLRMGEIARRARLSKQTMTTLIRLCERDGLVERRQDPDDRHATRIFPSAKARAFSACR
jgi:DNA-binding MarR family transcriptional regulator